MLNFNQIFVRPKRKQWSAIFESVKHSKIDAGFRSYLEQFNLLISTFSSHRTMPAELDDIELRSVQLQQSHSRDSISNACDLRRVPTDKGDILVAIQGDLTKPAILTLHDLGLNCKWAFRSLAFRVLILKFLQMLRHSLASSTIRQCGLF